MSSPDQRFLFLLASSRRAEVIGNSEQLARAAAGWLGPGVTQEWLRLAEFRLDPFVDLRHGGEAFQAPTGPARVLFDATLRATDIVFVSPVYWYSMPALLKLYLEQWTAWSRLPGAEFRNQMGQKSLRLITSGGDRGDADPMIDSVRRTAEFMGMRWHGAIWGDGGPPGAVLKDAGALDAASTFLREK